MNHYQELFPLVHCSGPELHRFLCIESDTGSWSFYFSADAPRLVSDGHMLCVCPNRQLTTSVNIRGASCSDEKKLLE